jgi:DNA polymerase III alpha subunit
MILPLFTTHFSVGCSALTLEEPSKCTPEGSDSLLQIAQELKLKTVVLTESTMISFKKAHESFNKLGIQLIYGVKFSAANNRFDEPALRETSHHKVIVFAKNDNGCKELTKLYSEAHTKSGGFVDYSLLKEFFQNGNLQLSFPFYSSFIHKNNFYGKQALPDWSFTNPWIFVGDHGLPFDELLRQKTFAYAEQHGIVPVETHSIYYKNRSDCEAMLVYRILTNRKQGKPQTLDNPNLEQHGSDNFCLESYLEKINT